MCLAGRRRLASALLARFALGRRGWEIIMMKITEMLVLMALGG
jgi:hypothetical protein